jgi:hypothetical protein
MEPEETSTVRLRIGKHVPAAMNTQAPLEVLLEKMFSLRPVKSDYKRGQLGFDC